LDSSYTFSVNGDANRNVSKCVVTAMRFTIDDKHLIKWPDVSEKIRRKTLAQDDFDRK